MAVNAIILAAGAGSRLRPFTADRPKSLVEVGGKPLLRHQLDALRSVGISDITVVTGYLSDRFQSFDVETVMNPRWETTNMVETLFCAAHRLGPDTVVAYGDIVYEPRVLSSLLVSPADVSVIVDRRWRGYWERRFADPLSDAESLRLDGRGRIVDIGAKVHSIAEIEAQYIGLMRFRGQGVDLVRRTREMLGQTPRAWMHTRPVEKAYMTDLLMEMVLTGDPPQGVPIDNGWIEIDTPDDYRLAQEIFASPGSSAFFMPMTGGRA